MRSAWRRTSGVLIWTGASLALATAAMAASAWTIVPSPSPTSSALNGVGVLSGSDVWAVGSFRGPGRHDGRAPLTLHWNGSVWSVVPAPDTQFNDDVLVAAAGVTATDVWAVGSRKRTNFYGPIVPMALHWNGSAWADVPTPPTGQTTASFAAAAAFSAVDVWAVGRSGSSALAEHWNGTAFATVPVPVPANTSALLSSISGRSTSDIWAVGTASGRTLVEHWNGTAWSIVPSTDLPPQRPGASVSDRLTGVVEIAPNDVWAVGLGIDTVSGAFLPNRTMIEHWDGVRWRLVASPNPKDHPTLSAIVGIAANDLWAVGYGYNEQSTGVPVDTEILLHWDGQSWSAASPPANVGDGDNLINGAAAGPGVTWAVGSSTLGTLTVRH